MVDDGRYGCELLWDCIEVKIFLVGIGVIDFECIGIVGGSYGGYMVLLVLVFWFEVFKVGIDIFGVVNWICMLESILFYWESFCQVFYQEIGDFVKDCEWLMVILFFFYVGEICKLLMVVQGKNDLCVIKFESDDIVVVVSKNGVLVDYFVFDDEGYGFLKKKNQIEVNCCMVEFFDKYLKVGVSQ